MFDESEILEISNLEKICFDNDYWSFESIKNCLNDNNYICVYNKFDNKIVSYVLIRITCGESELVRICTHPDYRNQGLGLKCINAAFIKLQNKHVNKIFLEVRKSNMAAINLYMKLGFEEVSIRKNYYHNPNEDAIIMKKICNSNI